MYEPKYIVQKAGNNMDKKDNRFNEVLKVLPQNLRAVLVNIPKTISDKAMEVSLRTNRPLCIECVDKRYYFTENNCVTDTIFDTRMVVVSSRDIFETFQNICNYSVYSRQNEINSGFVTMKGGHRAGLCGTAVINDGVITNIKNMTSINLRIAREFIGCSEELFDKVDAKSGVLICGVPCSGKTTILRDFARKLSYMYKVSLIDERNELSAIVNGVPQNDIGLCDVFDSYKKCDAIIHAVRNMSPDIIVCDEISTRSDIDALNFSLNSGVSFVATMHSDCIQNLLKRKYAKEIIDTGAFRKIVFLDTKHSVGKIKEVVDTCDLGDCKSV